MTTANPNLLLRIAAGMAIAFGLLTIPSGGLTLFGGQAARSIWRRA